MSAISDLYDALDTALAGLYATPTYRKLVNPYVLDQNDTPTLSRGWGFKIGEQSAANLTTGRYESLQVNIEVIQTIVHRGTDRDVSIRQTNEKLLLEDQFLLVDHLRQNTTVNPKIWKLDYVSTSGLEFVFTEQQNYFTITTNLSAVIAEGC